MKISINQPAFLPWINYFKRISEVDVFVILDDVQYEKNSFINRAQIKNKNDEVLWLTIPLKKYKFHSEENLIKNISISLDKDWKKKQVKTIFQNFSNQKNFDLLKDSVNKIYEYDNTNLSNFLTHQLKILIKILKIDTKIILSSNLNIREKKSYKILEICKRLNADEYISGPLGSDYLDKSLFEKNNIKFSYFDNENIHQHFENELSKFSILQSLSFYGDKLIDYLKIREQGMEPDNSDVIISNGKIADESQIKRQYVDRAITTAAFKKKNKSVVPVTKSLKPTVQVTSKDKIRLNLIKKRDHYFLINIYNENVRKRNFFGLKQIPLKEHFEWYNANKRKNIIFIAKLKSNIGYVRFTQKNKHWHVSIAIKKNYQRKGYGSYLLNKSIQKFKKKDTKIISTIKRSNISSVNFFKKNNFKYYFSDNKKIMLSHYVK